LTPTLSLSTPTHSPPHQASDRLPTAHALAQPKVDQPQGVHEVNPRGAEGLYQAEVLGLEVAVDHAVVVQAVYKHEHAHRDAPDVAIRQRLVAAARARVEQLAALAELSAEPVSASQPRECARTVTPGSHRSRERETAPAE